MGQVKNTSSSKSPAKHGDSTPSRLAQRRAKASRGRVTWADVDPARLQTMIDRITQTGALVSFSRTSDGGALHLRVLDGNDGAKEYATTAQEADDLIEEFVDLYQ